VKTNYNYVLPDQNGWSRYMHFQAAWGVLFVGLLYGIYGIVSSHFRTNLIPARSDRSWESIRKVMTKSFRLTSAQRDDAHSYNVLQRTAYLSVIFLFFPLIIWTGLAMAPGFTAIFPFTVDWLGGKQSARTIHFFVTGFLLLFLVVHVLMIVLAGFTSRMRAMTTGRVQETT
ncbi:MAG: cytochrome b/b6 domain-containing protein, partial [Gemmatimonadaceae bacterium]